MKPKNIYFMYIRVTEEQYVEMFFIFHTKESFIVMADKINVKVFSEKVLFSFMH